MARIETDPNYSSPTFSRATAATDIFKKEDVQALAAAVSTHTHASGLGLAVTGPINGSQIVDGTITSAKILDGTITSADILDGTIATVDIAAAAITQLSVAYGAASSPTTTSATAVDMPDMVVNLNCPIACMLRVDFAGIFYGSALNSYMQVYFDIDGTQPSAALTTITQAFFAASLYQHISTYGFLPVAAGLHVIKMKWLINTGTLTNYATYRALSVLEVRR